MKSLERRQHMKSNFLCKWMVPLAGLIIAAMLFSCGKNKEQGNQGIPNVTLNGAGATLPYPLYSRWTDKYLKLSEVKINYQSIGSGGGIAQIRAGTVDFGATDAPLSPEMLDSLGLIQFPMIISGIVPVVHLEGIQPGQLKMTPEILAGIYLGEIRKWNDPAITKINQGLNLPDLAITPLHRADASGTTWIFTNYLSRVSPEWKEKAGNAMALSWPAGVGGKGNEGVSAYIQRINGSIGYIAYVYALQNKLTYLRMQNSAGQYVSPSLKSFQAASDNANWNKHQDFYVVLTNQPGKDSWPITGVSFILMHRKQGNRANAIALLQFFDWCYRFGQDLATELHYVPIPQNVVKLAEVKWSGIRAENEPVWP